MTIQEMVENFKKRCESHPRYKEMVEKAKELAAKKKAEQESNNNNNNIND